MKELELVKVIKNITEYVDPSEIELDGVATLVNLTSSTVGKVVELYNNRNSTTVTIRSKYGSEHVFRKTGSAVWKPMYLNKATNRYKATGAVEGFYLGTYEEATA